MGETGGRMAFVNGVPLPRMALRARLGWRVTVERGAEGAKSGRW